MGSANLEAALRGDIDAFEVELRPLISPAYGLACAMLGAPDAAEDAVQDAAMKAWRSVRKLRKDTPSLRPWFLAIVANECRGQRRRRWWSVQRFGELPDEAERSREPDLAALVDLRRAVAALPAADKQLLYLFFELDLPFAEIATVLGTSVPAAKARLYRITRRLRPELALSEATP